MTVGQSERKAQPREITCSAQVPVKTLPGKNRSRIAPNPYRQLGYVDLAAKQNLNSPNLKSLDVAPRGRSDLAKPDLKATVFRPI